jgi:DHA1 family bicyclomycin/chloramphenicol resistance-like MFS transporter
MNQVLPSSPQRSATQFAIILGIVIAFGPLSIDLYLPALPDIAREFGVETSSAQFTISVFLIGLMTGQLFYGPIADRFGRKYPLIFGCSLYTLASIGCALSWSISSLTTLRFVQAIGGCAGVVIPSSVVRDLFDARESARMYSMLMLVMGLAPITAPLIGGQLLVAFGWRMLFWFLACFGLFCLAVVLFFLPETLPTERRSPLGIGRVLAAYGRLLSDRRFVGYAFTGGCVSAGMLAYITGSPFVFIELYGVSPQRYGWIFGANALGLILLAQLNRRLVLRYRGDSILMVVVSIIVASDLAMTIMVSSRAFGLGGLLVPLFVTIACCGLVFPNTAAAAMADYGQMAGRAAALLGTQQLLVGATSGMLVSFLQNDTALPMAAVITLCGISSLVIFKTLAMRSVPRRLADPIGKG